MCNIILFSAFIICALVSVSFSFPIGVNLPPLGGTGLGGQATSDVNWSPVSTDGGQSLEWQSVASVAYTPDLYPTSLPYTDTSHFSLAVCDIGAGADNVPTGQYVMLWDGDGAVDVTGAEVSCVRRGLNNSADVSITIAPGSTDGVKVRILRSHSEDPVRNVRLVPTAYEQNYTSQIFQPSFLASLKPFDHLRFTGWQKISSEQRDWAQRTLPSFQSQHLAGGVAVEHIVDILYISGIRSIALSFPLNSNLYNAALVDFLARNLPSDTIIYFEAGCPEFQGDTDRAVETIALADHFDTVFGNIKNIRDDVEFTWRAFASVVLPAYVPHLIRWFGGNLHRLHSVAVSAKFGRSSFPWDTYSSNGLWNIAYANKTIVELEAAVQGSLYVAEVEINREIQTLSGAHPALSIISYTAGPYFIANNYGYRAGKIAVERCASSNKFPCLWANTLYNFATQSEVDAALPMMQWNASQEQLLEEKFILVQRSPKIYDMYLDFLHRWEVMGGGLLISSNLVQPVTRCPTGGKGCGNDGLFEKPLQLVPNCSKSCAKYSALVDYRKGIRSALPFTSEDLPPKPTKHSCPLPCEWGTCQFGRCVCFEGYSGTVCNLLTAKRSDCNSDTGINLAAIADWSAELPYVDVFKGSRAWISQDYFPGKDWDTATPQHLSADYPSRLSENQRLGTMMIRDLKEHVPAGVYVVLYDGDGVLTFSMDVVAVKRAVGRIEVTVSPSSGLNNGLFLIVERTNPADPVRNIRVFMPGYEDWPVPFHPFFLDLIKNYKVLRFMDWANTNGAEYSNWNQRSRNDTRSYSSASKMPGSDGSGAGAPVEDMILLANIIGSSPWFNMPHLADDDFVLRYATLVKQNLRPDVKIYVEYSNEVWGTLFKGGQYAQQQGLALGLASSNADARFCFYVKRSSEIFTIWKTVFGPAAATRLEFVYASQSVNADVTRRMLRCAARLRVETNATMIAVAPYFGSYDHNRDTDLDVFMNTTLPQQIAGISSTIREHFTLASSIGMSLVTYESGQGLHGSGTNDDRAILANRDPRMGDLYVNYFEMLRSVNVSLMIQFSSAGLYNTEMCWGLMEAADQDPKNSPKYIGLQRYINKYSTCDLSAFDTANASKRCSFSGLYVDELERCECYYGSSGATCENNSYVERTDFCGYHCYFHQGVCLPDTVVGVERYWACSCNEGYYGHQCALFDCKDSCNYNGRCLDKDICSCFAGYAGEFCEVDCGCSGNGSCSVDHTSCICDVGYIWSENVAACLKHSIGGDGTCSGKVCIQGQCIDDICTCYAGYAGDSCDIQSGSRINEHSEVGTNLGGVSYWTTQWSFVDVMKMSSDWISLDFPGLLPRRETSWGNGMQIHLRDDGYPAFLAPGQMLVKLMLRDVQYHAPAGRYTCLFDGDGVVEFGFDAETVAIGKNRVEFMFNPTWRDGCTSTYCGDNGILLKLMVTNRTNPVHNIRVIMPGFEAVYDKIPYHPWFLKNIEPYSVIRFMDWQHTNANTDVKWTERTLTTHDTQARSGGVALEHMILLANILGANPWFCMPHAADDDYIRQFATMVHENLRVDLKIYVEYSNEVWNGLFPQADYASKRGLYLNLSAGAHSARYRFYSQRSVQIFKIWEDVFGTSAWRLKKVLSTQTVSAFVTQEILSWKNAYQSASMLGVAPYFDCDSIAGPAKAGYTAVLSVQAVIEECNSSWAYLTNYLVNIKEVAAMYQLPLITYEAGQALVESNVMEYGTKETAGLTDLLISVNRHHGMKSLYLIYMKILHDMGVFDRDRPLLSFVSCGKPSKYGSWGVIEFTGQRVADAPKYQALMQYFNLTHASCVGCTTNSISPRSYLHSDMNGYVGHPAVLSPRYNDVWISGEYQEIRWQAHAAVMQLELFIHQVTRSDVSTVIWDMETHVHASLGRHRFFVPSDMIFNGGLHFFVELRSPFGSNYSDVFSIQSKHMFDNISYICCLGDSIPLFGGCLLTNRSTRSNVRNHNSSWAVNASVAGQECSSPFTNWQSSGCKVDAYGCRDYRTLRSGSTYGLFKPVRDCVAQTSPFPPVELRSDKDYRNYGYTLDSITQCNSLIHNYPQYEDSCPADSGVGDLRCNISAPTPVPTARPTLLPSAWPTARGVTKRPTRLPTKSPTLYPSARPSPEPSRQPVAPRPGTPTKQPTLAPTAVTFLEADYRQSLAGISADEFMADSSAKQAFERTVASVVGVDSSTIAINNVTDGFAGLRRLREAKPAGSMVDYSVSVIIQDLYTQDFSEALLMIEYRITASVREGMFVRLLVDNSGLNSTLFENITISPPNFRGSHVTYLSAPPAMSPPDTASGESPLYYFVLMVAAAVVSLIFLIGCMTYCCYRNKTPAYRQVKVSPRETNSIVA